MIRAFIFDIGNVLLKFDFGIAIQKLQWQPELLKQLEPLKTEYESGQITRQEFIGHVRDIASYQGSDAELVAAWEDIFTENTPMTELVRILQPYYPLYLISNISDIHEQYIFNSYPVFGSFRDGVFSYKVKCLKPERTIYELACTQFNVIPSETVFIDDLLPNIEAAKQLGFHAFHYHHANHEALLEFLKNLGVNIESAGARESLS